MAHRCDPLIYEHDLSRSWLVLVVGYRWQEGQLPLDGQGELGGNSESAQGRNFMHGDE